MNDQNSVCNYCNSKKATFTLKNGKKCCSSSYQSCPGVKEKGSSKISKALKDQYLIGTRKSHFIKYNDGSNWKGRSHSNETKEKLSSKIKGRKMSNDFKENRKSEMTTRYLTGWEARAGRCKKFKYVSEIAGEVQLDGTWELEVAKFFDRERINWRRNKQRFKYLDLVNKERTYCPDFYLIDSNTYIEIKGYATDLDKLKWSQFKEKLEVWTKSILIEKKIIGK